MSRINRRLQGAEWGRLSASLVLVGYNKSRSGNVCGFYRVKGVTDEKRVDFWHWMNDGEILSFADIEDTVQVIPMPLKSTMTISRDKDLQAALNTLGIVIA